jgi:flagellar motor component MotA
MYLLAIILFLLGTFYGVTVGQDSISSAVLPFYDPVSLLIIIFITVPMLLSSGLFGDLKRAFKVISSKKVNYSKIELLRAQEAVRLTVRLLLLSGGFSTLISLITICRDIEDKVEVLGPNIALSLLTVFYSIFGCIIFVPIQSKLKVLILTAPEEKQV